MTAAKNQFGQAQRSAFQSIGSGKVARFILRKGLIIAIGASLTLPACQSHKLCEAYSNATLKKNKTATPASSSHILHSQI
jgi:riboflavin synthase alpha subunit